ncbi:MAG: hypothetical protein WKF74_11735 [Pyrinomonadaceae bacterium]
MNGWIKTVIPSFIIAIALSIFVGQTLKGQVSEPIAQGLAFWAMFLALYPANLYFSKKKHENSMSGKRFTFLKYALGATVGAIVVMILHSVF